MYLNISFINIPLMVVCKHKYITIKHSPLTCYTEYDSQIKQYHLHLKIELFVALKQLLYYLLRLQ